MSSTTALPLYAAVTEALTGVRYFSGDSTDKFLTVLHAAGFEVVARPTANDLRPIKVDRVFEQLRADKAEALTMPVAPFPDPNDLLPDTNAEVVF